jgi:hypothetical protein
MRVAAQALIIALLLAILAGVAMLVLTMAAVVNVPSGVGAGLAGQARSVVSGAQQALTNATDPTHPPSGLAYDTEFSSLQVVRTGDGLSGGTQYVLTLQAIKRRESAESPDTALYATVHAQLRTPRETRLLGQVVRSDADPHDYALYKGESFRIGRVVYRVNWISEADSAMAAAAYRNPDGVTAVLKFDYE